jgi:hypothetical protein
VLGDVATGGHADRLRSAVDRAEQWDAWVAAAGQVIPDQAARCSLVLRRRGG